MWQSLFAVSHVRSVEPSMFAFAEFVDDGGLMSYGVDTRDGLSGAANCVAKIFVGARPADLPVDSHQDGHGHQSQRCRGVRLERAERVDFQAAKVFG